MRDFKFCVGIGRNQIIAELTADYWETPFILAEIAYCVETRKNDREVFLSRVRALAPQQQKALLKFCKTVALSFSEDTD